MIIGITLINLYCTFTCIHVQLNHSVDMPSDAQRIQRVKLLADNGYADRVVIAHDMHSKHRLVSTLVHAVLCGANWYI